MEWKIVGLNREGKLCSVPTADDVVRGKEYEEHVVGFEGDSMEVGMPLALTILQRICLRRPLDWQCSANGYIATDQGQSRLVFVTKSGLSVRRVSQADYYGQIFAVGLTSDNIRPVRIIPEEDATG